MCQHCQPKREQKEIVKEVIIKETLDNKIELIYHFKKELLERDNSFNALPLDLFYKQKANTIKNLSNDEKLYFFQLDQKNNVIFPYIEDIRQEKLLVLEFKPLCSECEEILTSDSFVRIGNEFHCVTCAEDHVECSHCNEKIENDEHVTIEGNIYCYDCESELFFMCEKCNETFSQDEMHSFENQCLCSDCLNEISIECYDCNERINRDEAYYSERNDECYCENCYPSDNVQEFDSQSIDLSNNTFLNIKENFRFGIELEIDSDNIDFDRIENNTIFGSKEDGSLDCGSEFYSPILQGDKGYFAIKKFCGYVEGLKVTSSAGFHLHIGAENFNVEHLKKIYLTYAIIEKYIFAILPKSRRNNRYCKKVYNSIEKILSIENNDDFENVWNSEENDNGNRYFGLNLKALKSHETIELRYHSGTCDFDKIINWINLNFAIVNFALNNTEKTILKLQKITDKENLTIENLEKLFSKMGIDQKIISFYSERFSKLNNVRELAEV